MAGLYINHNLMALTASRNLGVSYSKLSTSINKLSSGLRINSAADDAAGLAVRELMRSDIAVLNQGQRNANDAISMLQTMDGAAGVIDEKLIRMKELAEQAATGTYNDTQRGIMQGEFDQMRQEIGRIAQATDFNGVKMLNVTSAGTAEVLSAAGDVNAIADTANITSAFTSLVTNATQQLSSAGNANTFANTAAFASAFTAFASSDTVTVHFTAKDGTSASGTFVLTSGETIATALSSFNTIISAAGTATWTSGTGVTISDLSSGVSQLATSFSNGTATVNFGTTKTGTSGALTVNFTTHNGTAATSTMTLVSGETIADFTSALNSLTSFGATATWTSGTGMTVTDNTGGTSQLAASLTQNSASVQFSTATAGVDGKVKIHFGTGNDSAEDYYYVNKQDMTGTGLGVNTLDISTQPGAQNALTTIDSAILTKDEARAHFGAMMNRLSNTVSNLSIQAENVQAAESQISDVDVATEMTKFVNSQIKSQAAVAMLSQANNLPQMALSLISGR